MIKRSDSNPILKPNRKQSWETKAVFNGCPIEKDGKIYLLYRALSLPHYHTPAKTRMMFSDVGIAESIDGIHFKNRKRFVIPEYQWERFGCEDPRVTKLGDKYYIFYTALSTHPFNADGIKVGLAISKDLKKIEEKHLVTPFNAKGMALFPEKIKGKIWGILTVNTDIPPAEICLVSFKKEDDIWNEEYWTKWYKKFKKHSLNLRRKQEDQIEVGAPPIKTKYGWLIIYSYIKNYFSTNKVFTVEAVLLKLDDPTKIIARTDMPILTPEEYYEKIGLVPNIVFPSGTITRGKDIYLYYGAADTTCCLVFIKLESLLHQMMTKKNKKIELTRTKKNPILKPIKTNPWESKAVFNPAVIYLNGKVRIIYRAMSEDNTSTFGYAESIDGECISLREKEPIYIPREIFESKLNAGGNSGCEDPRITKIGDKIYMCYTAFDGINPPRVTLTWITVDNFLNRKWDWSKPELISPPGFDDKDAFIFPEKINGKYIIVHRSGDDIDFDFSSKLNFGNGIWLEEYRWLAPRKGWWDSRKVGAGAPVIKTEKGWLFIYHGVSDRGVYRLGVALLDLKDPTKIISRTNDPILEPKMLYEKNGQISNVVFSCGAVLIGKKLFVYYGGGDSVVAVASINIDKLFKALKPNEGIQ